MLLLPILLIAVILAADAGLSVMPESRTFSGAVATSIACGGPLLILLVQWAWTRTCRNAMNRGRVPGPIMSAERMAILARLLIFICHAAAILAFGWLELVRSVVGDLVLVDEVLALGPALLAILVTWAIYYPIEVRVREALLIRRLDAGHPIYPMPSRGRYVWRQSQLHIFLLLIPLLIILGASELIDRAARRWLEPDWIESISQLSTLAAGLLVFVLAPLLTRVLFSTESLGTGSMRETLSEICRRHRVRVRDLLVWKTDGMMINAAVMGLIAPLRYVLITDALLESMRDEEVQAVMAHEIGHVRRHHMPWLVACLLSIIILTEYMIVAPILLLSNRWFEVAPDDAPWIELTVTGLIVVAVFLGFGWVSRRFERQADTFAAQHLSGLGEVEPAPAPGVISGESVATMRNALMTICRLNSIDPQRKSWRHGSISWRIEYLESIVGRPLTRLRIDRQILGIKVLAAVCLAGAIGYETYAYAMQSEAAAESTGLGGSGRLVTPAGGGDAP